LLISLFFTLLIILFFVVFCCEWSSLTFVDTTIDEVLFFLTMPAAGTSSEMIWDFVKLVILPTVIYGIILIILWFIVKDKIKRKKIFIIILVISILLSGIQLYRLAKQYEVFDYLNNQDKMSAIVDSEYYFPEETDIEFPEVKRNLIYIFLESMEITYADESVGGGFGTNVIPELSEIALENESFSGSDNKINGALNTYGSTFTTGAIVSHMSGLPVMSQLGNDLTASVEDFYPNLKSLGDILADAGYTQEFILGSDITFGGRESWFLQHGNFSFFDYKYAIEQGLIPEDYYVWWGYEDEKLFTYAKEEVLRLAEESEPFNLTLLTVDTHFEDGYLCELCDAEFGDNRYANVMACSSRQVAEFINWIQQQSFYENTTIVIAGDHLTMDSDFCKGVENNYQRKTYVTYINSAVEVEDDSYRSYTTLDLFPTTLASLGCRIDGNRLGLGTNLFSSERTLVERYGYGYVNNELKKKSELLETIGSWDYLDKNTIQTRRFMEIDSYLVGEDIVQIKVTALENTEEDIDLLTVEINDLEGNIIEGKEFEHLSDNSFIVDINASDLNENYDGEIIIRAFVGDEESIIYEKTGSLLLLSRFDFTNYLAGLKELDNVAIMIAVKDEATYSLSEEQVSLLKEMGLEVSIANQFRDSYLALIDKKKIITESESNKTLSYEGTLDNGLNIKLKSVGANALEEDEELSVLASIIIGEEDYAINKRGFNIVVYDYLMGEVIDTVSFDTYADYSQIELKHSYNSLFKTLKVEYHNITSFFKENLIMEVYMYYWDDESIVDIRKVYLVKRYDNNGKVYYMTTINVGDYDIENFHFVIYCKDTDGTRKIPKLKFDGSLK